MIRVLIERHFLAGTAEELRKAELEARQHAIRMAGYISGESLRNMADPQHNLVISTWLSRAHWEAWEASETRARLLSRLEPILSEPEKITVFEPLETAGRG